MEFSTIITFIIYILGMLWIGFYFYKKTNDLSDYVLGGRGLNPAVAALSAGASDMSGWLLLGLPGALYLSGLNQMWIGIGLVIGAYLNWLIVAGRLRVYTEKLENAITIPDYFENRFNDTGRLLRATSAVVILLFFTLYIASGLVAGAVLFKNSFGMDYETALFVGSFVIVSYTFLGGYNAVSWTDFVQGILMLLALLAVPVVVMANLGDPAAVAAAIEAKGGFYLDPWYEVTAMGFISLMAWGMGYFGQPHILARFMSVNRVENIPLARRINMGWMILALIGALMTGIFGVAYFTEPLGNPETVFILFTQTLFNPWIAGILLAAILSAIMSTIDSQILVCSSTLTEDIYKSFLKKDAGQKELVWIGRITVVLIAVIAVSMAMNPESSILDLVSYAWAGFGAAFGPAVLFSLFWRSMSKEAALAGMLSGTVTVLVWKQLEGGIFEIYELLPAFLIASAAIYLTGKLRPAPKHVESTFDTCLNVHKGVK